MDMTAMVQQMLQLPEEQLAQMDHDQLYRARYYAKDQTSQNKLAKAEHRAYAREAVTENPAMAIPIGLATPLYQLYKALIPGSRSEGSLDQALSGLIGVGEGIKNAFIEPAPKVKSSKLNAEDASSTKG
jgi:hypothetical protein